MIKKGHYIMKDLITETKNLIEIMEFQLHQQFEHTRESDHYTFEEGRNYIKLLRVSNKYDRESSCVAGFIVKKSPKAIDNKTNEPFKVGDMLMAAGYNKPATNFARGNIFDYEPTSIRWTGIS